MTKKEILIRYREIVIEINTLEKHAAFLDKYIGGPRPVRSPVLTGMPRGTNDPEAAMVQQVEDDPTLEIRLKVGELQNYLQEFNRILASIDDDRTQDIIRAYYALGWTDSYIAKMRGDITDKRVNQIRLEYLKTLE